MKKTFNLQKIISGNLERWKEVRLAFSFQQDFGFLRAEAIVRSLFQPKEMWETIMKKTTNKNKIK
jgi:hypothetical protein